MASKWTQFEGQQKAACRKLKANASNETHDFIGGGQKKGWQKGCNKLVDFWEWLVENRRQVSLVIIAALSIGSIATMSYVVIIWDGYHIATFFNGTKTP